MAAIAHPAGEVHAKEAVARVAPSQQAKDVLKVIAHHAAAFKKQLTASAATAVEAGRSPASQTDYGILIDHYHDQPGYSPEI